MARRRKIAYSLLLFLLYLLQSTAGLAPAIWGQRIDVLPFALASIALLEGSVWGTGFGLLVGFLYDFASPTAQGGQMMYFLLAGLLAGWLGKRYFRKVLPSSILLGFGIGLPLALLRFAWLFFGGRVFYPLWYFRSLSGQMLASVAFSPFVYLLVRSIHHKWASSEADSAMQDRRA